MYGVSGGNGVILVTTKKGKTGKPELGYSLNYGVQTVTKYPRFVNSAEYATLKNEASTNLGGPLIYTPEEIEKFRQDVSMLIAGEPSIEEVDDFLSGFQGLMQQPLVLH